VGVSEIAGGMHQTVIADSHGKILWLSYIAPEYADRPILGTSIFDWVKDPKGSDTLAAAIGAAFIRSTPTTIDVDVGSIGGDIKVRTRIERLEDLIVLTWTIVPDANLSIREIQVLDRICEGMSASEIAADLGISTSTVETHRASLLRKTDSDNSVTLSRWAIRHGFLRP
jgi:DNA-binding CsgD family transcriptional regulator